MATYDSLSEMDKSVVQSTTQLIRSACGSIARDFNLMKAIADDQNAIDLILSIDPGEMIPNESGLDGADDLTRAELVSIWNEITAMKAAYDTPANREDWSKAAGAPNLLRIG